MIPACLSPDAVLGPTLFAVVTRRFSVDQPLRLLSHGTKHQRLWLARNHIAGSAYNGYGGARITQMSDFSILLKRLYGRGAGRGKSRFRCASLTGGIGPTVAGSVYDLKKRPYDTGIELGPRVLLDLPQSGFAGDAITVRPGTDHGIERVGHRDYPCYQGNVLAAKPVRVSFAVEALVMVFDDRQRGCELCRRGEDRDPECRMPLYLRVLIFGQATSLLQDTIRYAYLTYIVQQCPAGQGFHLFAGQGDLAADAQGET